MGDRALRWLPLALVAAACAWVVSLAASPIHDPDSWWHLRLGSDLISRHSLAAPPHWSSYATVAWVPTEPLPEIASAWVERWLGLPGLATLFGVALLLLVLTVYVTNRLEAAILPAAIATALTVPAATLSLTPRPQVVSFILLPIVLAAWLQTERDLRPRWWLVPLVWFWSLCHGFWVFGVVIGCLSVVGIALSRRVDRRVLLRLASVAVASGAVVALNPVGLGVLEAPFVVKGVARYVEEWQRTQLIAPAPLVAGLLIIATALIWALTREGVTWSRLLLLALALVSLWYAARLVVVAALLAAPLFAQALDGLVARSEGTSVDRPGRTSRTRRPGRPARPELRLLVCAGLAGVAVMAALAQGTSQHPGRVPVGLDATLDTLPAGTPVFNSYGLGGWLAWRHPDLNQYIDGLATPYSQQHVQDYVDAVRLRPDWASVVRRSGAPVALLGQGEPLAQALEGRGWTVVGSDSGYVLLRRPSHPTG